jgi:hypothetical protein
VSDPSHRLLEGIMTLRIAKRASVLAEMPRWSARIPRSARLVLLISVTVFAARIVSGVDDKRESDVESLGDARTTNRYFDESMFVSLYDADRVHYLLREFCKEKNLTLEYQGCMTQSENRPGIQCVLPTGATLWTVQGVARREFMCQLISAHRAKSNDGWRLKIGKSSLAIVLVDPDRFLGREAEITGQMTVGRFFEEFCPFAEQRMKTCPFGVCGAGLE